MLEKGKQGYSSEIHNRIPSEQIYELLNFNKKDRDSYLKAFEAGYNLGPGKFPPQVFIELTSTCNLKCTFCHYPDMKRPNQEMDEKLAKKVIDECAANNVWYITFQFYGEPLLSADLLARMVKYAKNKGIPVVNTTSNMTILTEKKMKMWCDAGLDTLNISFEGVTKEKYEEVRGAKYEKVLNNIKLARKIRDEYGNGKPFLSLSLVRTDETIDQLADFKSKMSEWVDAFDIRSLMMFNYRTESTKKYEDAAPDWYVTRDLERRIPCRQIGPKLIITSQGEATVCCTDIDGELSFGNVREKSIKEMWNSDEMARLYMVHRQQRWEDLPDICKDCKDWDWQGAMPDWEALDKRWQYPEKKTA